MMPMYIFFVKVDVFWEGHKNFTKSVSSVKNKREISQNFVAFSEYTNFFRHLLHQNQESSSKSVS